VLLSQSRLQELREQKFANNDVKTDTLAMVGKMDDMRASQTSSKVKDFLRTMIAGLRFKAEQLERTDTMLTAQIQMVSEHLGQARQMMQSAQSQGQQSA
jgi:hypothetical protein